MLLGQGFETACGIHRVADRGQAHRVPVTKLADNGRAAMDTDTDTQWLVQIRRQ